MKTQISRLMALGFVLSIGSFGCQSTRYGVTPLGDKAGVGGTQTASLPVTDPVAGSENDLKNKDLNELFDTSPAGGHNGWAENQDALKDYTVHFEYDSTTVRPAERTKLEAVASQLKASSSVAVRIEGHCDERGTEEYNRALGERRALALREELIRLGIDPARLDTRSYGDAKPAVVSHDETGWKQNRRGEFVSLSAPN
jgi:peptidoglycan-associated lipoprotein